MSYLAIILMCIGMSRAALTFNLPDFKPFNCQSCLSFWLSVMLFAYIEWQLIGLSFITYLLSDILLTWENK
jgi:hypothetical protein